MSTITQFPSGNTQYRIEFDYLARTFVVVTLVNSSNPTLNRVLEVGRDYRFLSPTMIEMLIDQSGFDIVRIHRQTGTDLVVDFRNGSVLTASDLTNSELQAIHIAEEGRDQTVDLAKEYADAAGNSAGNAKDSEDEARQIAASIKAAGRIGYITRRSFEKGFNITTWNEVLLWEEDGEYYRWDGTLPKNVPAGSTPETSEWVSVGDASLRADLSLSDGEKLLGECNNITTLRTIEPNRDGQRITLREHTAGTGYGGGQFRAKIDGSNYADNNGTIIKTTGGAVWLRINADILNPLMFGAQPSKDFDSSASFRNALATGSIHVPDGEFKVVNVQVPNNTSIRGNGYKSKIVVPAGQASLLVGNSSAGSTVDYFDCCNVSDIHIFSESKDAGTVGLKLNGISSSRFENICFTKTHAVIQQDHAEGCQFINIYNSDLEDGNTDPNFVVFSRINKRSNDNIYSRFIARATDTEIYLGMASGVSSQAQHDGITIKDCILFPCQNDNIYAANITHSSIINNKLFVPGRNNLRVEYAMVNTNVQNNEFAWAGRFTAGGADAVLIQTAAGSGLTAYGQCDISGNVASMPSGCAFRVNGLAQFNIHHNTIVSPNNIKTTVTGPFTAKKYDAIRINAGCGYFTVDSNMVTTGRHGQGGDDFSTNWRFDVYVESGVMNGLVKHDTINVRNLSTYCEVVLPRIDRMMKQRSTQKEVRSPYAIDRWVVNSGSVTMSVVSSTNPYDEEATNVVQQFVFPGGESCTVSQPQVATAAGGSIGANFMVRCVGVTSAWVTFSLSENGGVPATHTMMINDGWNEVDLRKIGTITAGYSMFSITTADACTIQIAELRVTPTKKATQTSGVYFGTSAPVVGFWKLGDVVMNSAPATGSPRGWVCTTSGIPGVWVPEGNL